VRLVREEAEQALVSVLANKYQGCSIIYCSYTGKATSVLRKKFYEANITSAGEIKTLHSLMYYPVVDERTGVVRAWKRREKLDYNLVVVDEASMLDQKLFEDLQKYGVPILAVGDHGQLPPVMGSFNLMEKPMLKLETIHRQAQDSPILALSEFIRRVGQVPRFTNSAEVQVLDRNQLDAVIDDLFKTPDIRYDDIGLLCYTNRLRVHLNLDAHAARWGGDNRELRVGDQVICLRNMEATIFNGMRGVVTKLDPQYETELHLYATVLFEDEEIEFEGPICKEQLGRTTTFQNYDEYEVETGFRPNHWHQVGALFDYGYALTTHKAQGSQFEHVIVVAERPGRLSLDDWKRWLYTAVTRCSKYLVVLQ
jgi:exodeoxyribonuclease-5